MWLLLDLTGNLRDRLGDALDQFARVGFGLIEAIIVFAIAWLLSRLIRKPLRRRLRRSLLPPNIQVLVVNGLRIAVFLVAISILLAIWGLTLSGFLAAVSISTIIVALGFQAALQSLLGGVLILLERPFGVGDRIKFSGQEIEGTVTDIGMRSIVLKNDRGERTTAPNSLIFTLGVTNLTPNRTAKTILRISNIRLDAQHARETAEAALASDPVLPKPSELRVRSRIARLNSPFDDLKGDLPSLGRVADSVIAREHDLDITWPGILESAALEQAKARLEEVFPNSEITARKR
jgi:small-conductance mechanosensitive channel